MSKTKVAILYPTRGRAQQAYIRLTDVLTQEYPAGVELSVYVCAEATDKATIAAVSELAETGDVTLLLRQPNTTSVYGWNQAYAAAKADGAQWVVLGADDVEWKPGWLETALAAAKSSKAQLVGLLDGHDQSRRYGPHYMAAVAFLEKHLGGVMCVPHYQSWSFDYEASERADGLGLYAPTPQPVIDHHHPDWGMAEMDETYEKAWPLHAHDRALREQRQRAGYPTNYGPAVLEAQMWTAPENKMQPEPENKEGEGGAPTVDEAELDITPAALKALKKAGIDPATVKGTGAGGRIILADAEAAIEDSK